MVLRAETKVEDTIMQFLDIYYEGRLPTVPEIAEFTGLPEQVIEAMLASEEEGV